MKKYKKRNVGVKGYVALKVFMLALLTLMSVAVIHVVIFYYFEPSTSLTRTNTDAIYSSHTFNRYLLDYPDIRRLGYRSVASDAVVIPGLKATRTLKSNKAKHVSICTAMTPQGICTAGSYILVSAYCHSGQHNSVIYVIDRMTKKFLKEIVLQGKPHAGSITYDAEHENVWVANLEGNQAFVNALSLKDIEKYHLSTEMQPLAYKYAFPILTQTAASFMTYYDHALYIGKFSAKRGAVEQIQRFEIEDNGGLQTQTNADLRTLERFPDVPQPTFSTMISGKCQGLAVFDRNILISQSYGMVDSHLRVFSLDVESGWMDDTRNKNTTVRFTLPSMMEQIHVDESGNIYVLFESAAYPYRYRPGAHIDRILILHSNVMNRQIEKSLAQE